MKHLAALTVAALAIASTAQAQSFADQVAAKYRDMDFGFVEVKNSPSQVKVEAVKDATKYEVVYDKATGAILKQETETASLAERARRGVEFDTEDRDFLRSARAEDDDRGRGRGRSRVDVSDDDDDDDRGRGRGRGRGGDDDRDDDDSDRSGRGGSDDRGGDDSGRGGDDRGGDDSGRGSDDSDDD